MVLSNTTCTPLTFVVDEMVKHAPSMEETLDSVTQGASLFLDPAGAQVGEEIQGQEGVVYADLNLEECVEPKQFHDTVGYYQRYDVFDLKVNRQRQGVETTFQPGIQRPVESRESPTATVESDGSVSERTSSNWSMRLS